MIEWKFVTDTNEMFKISSCGQVYSIQSGVIKKQQVSNCGYLRTVIRYSYGIKQSAIHRLVALHFIENPNLYPCVNHEDGRTFGISSYLSARVHDLMKLGVPIEKKQEGMIKRFRLRCTCSHRVSDPVTEGCYVHDLKLKV